MLKEIGIGLLAGAAAFLLTQGVNLLPVVFLGGLVLLFLQTSGFKSIQRKFASVVRSGSTSLVTFNDVGGQASAKRELMEALEFLTSSEHLRRLGIRPLRGILLTGPPGTGKTLLAKASAAFTSSVFLATSGSEFIEVYAGVGAQRVRELFGRAREIARKEKRASAIVFIDEIEVLGGKRGSHMSHLEYDQTLNQLLVEMDGLSLGDDVKLLVIGATNRSDLLDPALLRPGRFDRIIRVELPDREGRLQVLRLHTRNKPLGPDVDLDTLAKETFGFSGAHLESLANEAAILALRSGTDKIGPEHFSEAIDKVMMGEKLDRRPRDSELARVALHEAGHAVAGELVAPGSVSSVTISPRGTALGYTRNTPEDDLYLYPREKIEEEIVILLAGAIAEEIHYGSRSTGSASDFDRAVLLAKRIVLLGMSPLGVVDADTIPSRSLSRAIGAILLEQEKKARGMLEPRHSILVRLSEVLTEHERMSGEDIRVMLVSKPDSRQRRDQKAPERRSRMRSPRRIESHTALLR
ncbi:MAG: AAA family ATPase [Bacillota bacterium]|nr:AAA family ATPase [Bacillota bacterium]